MLVNVTTRTPCNALAPPRTSPWLFSPLSCKRGCTACPIASAAIVLVQGAVQFSTPGHFGVIARCSASTRQRSNRPTRVVHDIDLAIYRMQATALDGLTAAQMCIVMSMAKSLRVQGESSSCGTHRQPALCAMDRYPPARRKAYTASPPPEHSQVSARTSPGSG
jgi:hypothetical protein